MRHTPVARVLRGCRGLFIVFGMERGYLRRPMTAALPHLVGLLLPTSYTLEKTISVLHLSIVHDQILTLK